mgnify:CR=1 FL=1
MIHLEPKQISDLWQVDGSLRDVYAKQMTMDRWEAFLSLALRVEYRYTSDGEPATAPDARTIFGDRNHSHLLTLLIAGAQINCHFFTESELELDIDPGEVLAANAHAAVLRFLETVGAAIQLPLSITPENFQSSPYLSYESEGAGWTWYDANSSAK